ncbi:MAG: hypothetical protein ACRCRZ_03225, partial [Metamycoplasmataceae bacterium]
ITKSSIVKLVEQGFKAEEIAKEIGVSKIQLGKFCKHFNINLRAKPRNNFNLIDDTIEENIVSLETKDIVQEVLETVNIITENKNVETKEILEVETVEETEEVIETVEAEESNDWEF